MILPFFSLGNISPCSDHESWIYEEFYSDVNAGDCCMYDIELYFFFPHRNYLYGGWILENVISL